MSIIELVDLKKVYMGNHVALDGVSMTIPHSTVFGLLGPNGAGKSTIINILAGVVKRSEGIAKIFGKTIEHDDYIHKKDIGFVLEDPHYLEKLTATEYLHFCGALYELKSTDIKERVNELLTFFDLKGRATSQIETYSNGMKKKVSLAAALIHQPKLLILDEPLEGIDPTSAKQIKDTLRLMADRGVTVVLSSHNLDTVEKFCDEVAIIHKGKLVFQTKTEEIRIKIKDEVSQERYQSLEEIFIDVVSDEDDKPASSLSWL
ncbi:ABC transporter ATP-binding protein [Rhodohalobacter sulfatireducens]|uniref:ABC transporter ATP-binding protein n=1 Tax=Rhodohalobacter sulfatireducens TaxID=2911366 RepID=A0ABS9KEA2_9BACT|nr:ABC transporter ATP-binding protein [Rhodohalobacter sulfatireducens]MCG2589188.1 ABC transporter ATP-binding protein [Rhodohalobacter sulfatireducens]